MINMLLWLLILSNGGVKLQRLDKCRRWKNICGTAQRHNEGKQLELIDYSSVRAAVVFRHRSKASSILRLSLSAQGSWSLKKQRCTIWNKKGFSLSSSDQVFLLAIPPCCSAVWSLIRLLSLLEVMQFDLWYTLSVTAEQLQYSKGLLCNIRLLLPSFRVATPTGFWCRLCWLLKSQEKSWYSCGVFV